MHGDELKLIYPQAGAAPERFSGQDFQNFFLQPMDNPDRAANTEVKAQIDNFMGLLKAAGKAMENAP